MKLTINADTLQVESFETTAANKAGAAEYENMGTCSGRPCTPCCIEPTCQPDCR